MIAIVGAGELGGAIASRLAGRGRVRRIRLIDERADVASGKALDIAQTSPIARVDVRVTAASDVLTAAGASVIVIADAVDTGEWREEDGGPVVERILRAGSAAPIVFAGPCQTTLMERCASGIGLAADRLVGTAPAALVGTVRSLVAAELDGSPADISVTVTGRPPNFVIAWSAATVSGSLVAELVPAHRLRAISATLRGLWPPGPQAIASATALVVEALASGSRQRHQALAIGQGEYGARGTAVMLPLELGPGRILRRFTPTLSPRERVEGSEPSRGQS